MFTSDASELLFVELLLLLLLFVDEDEEDCCWPLCESSVPWNTNCQPSRLPESNNNDKHSINQLVIFVELALASNLAHSNTPTNTLTPTYLVSSAVFYI